MKFSNVLKSVVVTCALLAACIANAGQIQIKWSDFGGLNQFNDISRIEFSPIYVDELLSFESEGLWKNAMNSEGSTLVGVITFKLDGEWTHFAEIKGIQGAYHSEKSIQNISLLGLNLKGKSLEGIIFNNSILPSGNYLNMNVGSGTVFTFSKSSVSEPSGYLLIATMLVFIFFRRKISAIKNS